MWEGSEDEGDDVEVAESKDENLTDIDTVSEVAGEASEEKSLMEPEPKYGSSEGEPDATRLYLNEIGAAKLLTAEEEVEAVESGPETTGSGTEHHSWDPSHSSPTTGQPLLQEEGGQPPANQHLQLQYTAC